MTPYVEHANITVGNIDHTIKFIQTALPAFAVRHSGQGDSYRWCHIGTEHSYLALQEVVERSSVDRTPYRDAGINHIGFFLPCRLLVLRLYLCFRPRVLRPHHR